MKTYDENFALDEAIRIAQFSPCRSKRGVVIWHREYGLVSWGFNSPPEPFKCDGSVSCKSMCRKTAIHAEQKALLRYSQIHKFLASGYGLNECEMLHIKTMEGIPVISGRPSCWQCSKMILEAGIKRVWLYHDEGLEPYSTESFHRETLMENKLYFNL